MMMWRPELWVYKVHWEQKLWPFLTTFALSFGPGQKWFKVASLEISGLESWLEGFGMLAASTRLQLMVHARVLMVLPCCCLLHPCEYLTQYSLSLSPSLSPSLSLSMMPTSVVHFYSFYMGCLSSSREFFVFWPWYMCYLSWIFSWPFSSMHMLKSRVKLRTQVKRMSFISSRFLHACLKAEIHLRYIFNPLWMCHKHFKWMEPKQNEKSCAKLWLI